MKSMIRSKKTPARQTIIVGTIVAFLLIVIVFLGWKYYELKKDPNATAKATVARIVKQVGAIYELPTDEEPTMAQIQDKSRLAQQEFYSKAQNGDYVLVYSKNKVAFIYREKTGKLVNVGPVNFVNDGQQQVSGAQAAKPVVSILNGSGSIDKLNAVINKLNELNTQITLTSTADASSRNTGKTIVVDVSGQHAAAAQAIADTLGAGITAALPSGQSVPSGANIVVIVGGR